MPDNGGSYQELGISINVANNTVNWDSTDFPVYYVYVKGGNQHGNLYHYPEGSTGDIGLIVPTNQNISHVTFYYCNEVEKEITGTLTVKKIIKDFKGHLLRDDDTPFEFTIIPYKGCKETKNITVNGGSSQKVDLPVGWYILKEVNIPDGYFPLLPLEVVKVFPGFNTRTIFINYACADLEEEFGTLTIAKTVMDSTGETMLDNNTSFTFNIKNNNQDFDEDITIIGNGSQDITLPAGSYTITETNIPGEYEQDVSAQTATLAAGGTAAVTFTNRLKAEPPTTGTLTINKTVVNSSDEEINDDTEFTFTIEPIYRSLALPSSLIVKGGSSETINLPAGEYRIAEENIPEAYKNDVEAQFVTIENGSSSSLTFTNKLKAEPITTGTLTITKVVKDSEGIVQEDDNTAFEFSITPAAVRPMSTLTSTPRVVTVNAGSSKALELPAGDYLVKEINIPAGYENEVEAQEISITAGKEHSLTFNNTLLDEIKETNGTLTITKVVKDSEGVVQEDDNTAFQFAITPAAAVRPMSTLAADTLKVTVNAGSSKTIELPAGDYLVTEINIPEDYAQNVAAQTVQVKAEENSTITFTNKLLEEIIIDPPPAGGDEEEGTLTITKQVVDGDDNVLAKDEGLFTFVVTNNNTKEKQTISIKGNDKKTITLLAGSYTVKETSIPEDYAQNVAAQTVQIKAEENSTVTFTNERLEEIIVEPEDPAGNDDEDKDEDVDEKELPKTHAADLLKLGLGFLVTAGGWILRRKRK